jgi:hypothetical protein
LIETEALAMGDPVEGSFTLTAAPLLNPDANAPAGTLPVGKLITEATMLGGVL